MRSILNRMVVVLAIGALTASLTWAKTTEREVTFNKAVTVNETLVKKGTYKVVFNEETGELTIRKGKKVIATAQARLEKTEDRYTSYIRSDTSDPSRPPLLLSVSLSKGSEAVLVNGSDNRATGGRQ